jgi:hypothetical protein
MQTKSGAFCSNETGKSRTQGLTRFLQRRKSNPQGGIKIRWLELLPKSALEGCRWTARHRFVAYLVTRG